MSEMSLLIAVTLICWRTPSMRNPRRSGCVSVALHVVLNCGLKFENKFDETCLLLLNPTATLPPPHISDCEIPALYVDVSFCVMVPPFNWLAGGLVRA